MFNDVAYTLVVDCPKMEVLLVELYDAVAKVFLLMFHRRLGMYDLSMELAKALLVS
jgi:hypothetical protein